MLKCHPSSFHLKIPVIFCPRNLWASLAHFQSTESDWQVDRFKRSAWRNGNAAQKDVPMVVRLLQHPSLDGGFHGRYEKYWMLFVNGKIPSFEMEAIEHDHWNSWFPYYKWGFSMVMLVYRMVTQSPWRSLLANYGFITTITMSQWDFDRNHQQYPTIWEHHRKISHCKLNCTPKFVSITIKNIRGFSM